ncbi:MAG: hypothetical protein LUQ38_09020 [Methanotrichaceae archaeon]|nr:hypothetical protein [Methanotrichaceae archaeon]
MLKDNQRMVSLFEDDHKLEGVEATSYIQFGESTMQPPENASVVAFSKENLVNAASSGCD